MERCGIFCLYPQVSTVNQLDHMHKYDFTLSCNDFFLNTANFVLNGCRNCEFPCSRWSEVLASTASLGQRSTGTSH